MSETLHRAAVHLEAALDQLAGAGADHVARRLQRDRGHALAVEHVIERGDQVGRGVDQRAVEIEDNSAGKGHRNWLSVRRAVMQVAMAASPDNSVPSPVDRQATNATVKSSNFSDSGRSWRCSCRQNDARHAPAGSAFSRGIQLVDMDGLKRQAAARALEHVQDGMKLGLGTGSTAKHFVELLGEKVAAGMRVIGVPTSEATRAEAERCKIPLTTLDEIDRLDLTVDGADEVDHALNLIKGGGGALLREKIVAAASDRMIVIADDTKWVDVLGRFPLPVEVIPFGLAATQRAMADAFAQSGVSGQMGLRKGRDGHVFVTDGGHWIVDAHLGRITDAPRLAGLLSLIPGVVEHGLFIGLAGTAVLAGAQGIRVVERR